MVARYIPNRGDLVWLNFDPSVGREQQGRRPAIVLSLSDYNNISDLAILMPITSRRKGYPFEVLLPKDLPIQGVILCDQIKSLSWRSRDISFIAKAPTEVLINIRIKTEALLFE
jgi:mRNA interferase MazF